MKTLAFAMLSAILASLLTLNHARSDAGFDNAAVQQLAEQLAANEAFREQFQPRVIRFSAPSEQDAWIKGSLRGEPRPGPATDEKPLADSANSVCFLSKVEFEGMDGAEDTTSCEVTLDEFTGWWQINASQGDGTDSSVSCNARCIVWE